ncbi:MAG: phosphoribosylformylglycinamidine synthase I [Planctomycetes bacterium]|nr:phosphoribosylformylglycinamidine synthase I [Planctomycetota bacterium]
MKPNTLIIRTAGTNCDLELAHAFELAGADVQRVHLNDLIARPEQLDAFDMLALAGGFSYGDDIAAGRIFANRLRHALYPALRSFIAAGKPVIGICNGFQLMVKAGLLPGFELPEDGAPPQIVTLTDNANMRFIDQWVGVRVEPETVCIWTQGLDRFELPIAHGEGRFLADDAVLDRLEAQKQVALRYTDNPNGSRRDIAGVCDPTGLVFGLMPHPERFTHKTNHPHWTRKTITSPAGLKMFTNAVAHVTQTAAAAS